MMKLTQESLEQAITQIKGRARDRRGDDTRPRHVCARLGAVVTERECLSCQNDIRSRTLFRQQAELKFIPWWRYPCAYETEVRAADLIPVEDSVANNHWADTEDQAQKEFRDSMDRMLRLGAEGSLLSVRLSMNLRYWMKEAVKHVEFLKAHVASAAGEYHLSKVSKLVNMLQGEMQTWERLSQGAKHDGENLLALGTPSVQRCIFSTEVIGSTSESCCGGKLKDVPLWGCLALTQTTEKACSKCTKYIGQADLSVAYNIDFLVGSKDCDDCKAIELQLQSLQGKTRELFISNLQSEAKLREFLDVRMQRQDLFGPALFVDYNLQTGACGRAMDDPEEILDYLKQEEYIKG